MDMVSSIENLFEDNHNTVEISSIEFEKIDEMRNKPKLLSDSPGTSLSNEKVGEDMEQSDINVVRKVQLGEKKISDVDNNMIEDDELEEKKSSELNPARESERKKMLNPKKYSKDEMQNWNGVKNENKSSEFNKTKQSSQKFQRVKISQYANDLNKNGGLKAIKYSRPFWRFLEPEIDPFWRFLGPEIAKKDQFLEPETDFLEDFLLFLFF